MNIITVAAMSSSTVVNYDIKLITSYLNNRASGFRSLRCSGSLYCILKDIFYRPGSIIFFILTATASRLVERSLEYAAVEIVGIFIVTIDYPTTFTVARG